MGWQPRTLDLARTESQLVGGQARRTREPWRAGTSRWVVCSCTRRRPGAPSTAGHLGAAYGRLCSPALGQRRAGTRQDKSWQIPGILAWADRDASAVGQHIEVLQNVIGRKAPRSRAARRSHAALTSQWAWALVPHLWPVAGGRTLQCTRIQHPTMRPSTHGHTHIRSRPTPSNPHPNQSTPRSTHPPTQQPSNPPTCSCSSPGPRSGGLAMPAVSVRWTTPCSASGKGRSS